MDVSLGLGFDAWEVEASAYAEDRRPTASPPHQTSGEGSPWGSLGDQRYYIKEDKFWQCNNYFNCGAFRAYFTVTGSSSPSYTIVIGDDDITGIDNVELSNSQTFELSNSRTYTLDGRPINSRPSTLDSRLNGGIIIVKQANGKTQKVMIK